MWAIQKTKEACLSTAWHLITHVSLKGVPRDQGGMTLCLSGTVEKDETGETELEGGVQKINVSIPFCLFTQISVGRTKNLKISILFSSIF